MNTQLKTLAIAAASLVSAIFTTSAFAASDEYTLNQNLPSASAPSASRAEVRAATVSALRAGAVQFDEYTLNQYPKATVPSTVLRAQVVAETIEANKLGLIAPGEAGIPVPTAAQLERIRLAGQNAVKRHVAAR